MGQLIDVPQPRRGTCYRRAMRLGPLVLALVFALGCSKKRKPEPVSAVPPEEAPRELRDDEIGAAACAGRVGCKLEKVMRAGTRDAVSLAVAEVSFEAADAGPDTAGVGAGEKICDPHEAWLVRTRGKVLDRKLLLEICNDGYGASGVGEDELSVETPAGAPPIFRHVQSGGSSNRWEHTSILELAPMRLRAIEWWSGYTIAAAVERGRFDFVDFRGHVRWFRPPCPEGGGPPEDEPGAVDDLRDGPELFVYDVIPAAVLPDSFDFRTTALDSCAPLFDGTDGHGFVTHGPAVDPRDASMRVVARQDEKGAPHELFIEVRDDVFTGPTAKWLYDDHLELWIGDEDPDAAELCLPSQHGGGAGRLRQWAVRVADGKTFPGYGAPTLARDPIVVERAEATEGGAKIVRFHVTIGTKDPDRISVVYSDGDDGKTQKRLIATSRLVFGKAATVGRLWSVPREEATCAVQDGKLVRVLHRDFAGDHAALADVP